MNAHDPVEAQLAAEAIGWQQANDRHVIERDEAEAKLARIAALRDKAELGKGSPWFMEQVSAVLDCTPHDAETNTEDGRPRYAEPCISSTGMSSCSLTRGHAGPHHDDLSRRSW
jgi:hypothetical protein